MTRASRTLRCAAILFAVTVSASAASQAERDLAQAQVALATANRERAQAEADRDKAAADAVELRKSLGALTLQTKTQGHTTEAATSQIITTQNINDQTARRTANEAKDTAAATAAHADDQQEMARDARDAARKQISNAALAAWLAAGLSALGLVFPPWWKRRNELQDRKWAAALEAAKVHSDTVLAAAQAVHAETAEALRVAVNALQPVAAVGAGAAGATQWKGAAFS